MLITENGAILIATVYPLALLVIGFEIKQVPQLVATSRAGTVGLWVLGILFMLGLLGGMFSIERCIRSVATGIPLNSIEVFLIAASGQALFVGVALLLFGSLAGRLGLIDALGRRAAKRLFASERGTARILRYVEKHHPNVRKGEDSQ